MVRQALFGETITMEFCSKGQRLGSTLNQQGKVGLCSQGAG